jgi:hypothetical protein
LSAQLVDYARQQCIEPHSAARPDRDVARRRRAYAITQTIYEDLRLQPGPSTGSLLAPWQRPWPSPRAGQLS